MVHNPHINPLELSSINAFQRNVETTTPHYNFINTRAVLEQLADNGWEPVAANQAKVKDISKEGFQKHFVKLENPSLNALLPTVGKPQMLLRHAHDGTSALNLLSAFKIFVCSNGAVSHSGDIGDVRVLHRGFNEEKLQSAIDTFVKRIPIMVTQVEEWQSVQLSQQEQYLLAQQAIELRFDPITNSFGETTSQYPVRPEQVLQSRRFGERPTNLWTAFNNLQENLIEKGGLIGARNANNRRIPIRAVRGIDSNIKLNKAFWALSAHMADLKLGRTPSVEVIQ
jgi:hypothetical protein